MPSEHKFEQQGQNITGPQTNIAGDVQGDFIYNEATKIRLPFYRPRKVEHFIGREDDMTSLMHDLQPGKAVTICGPGGMGKTALATEAIWRIAPENKLPELFPDGIIFYTFYHRPEADLALETVARAYEVDPRPSPLEAAQKALSGRRALIVLDGAEACDDLRAVLSVTSSCGVLITTRSHSDAPADFKDLSPLPAKEAVQLLQAWGGRMASDTVVCQSICSLLGGLPLAIFLAGSYMSRRSQFAGEYLVWLEKTPLAALDLGKRQHESIPLLMEHSLAQVSDKARECLGVAGILALRPFDLEIIFIALQISKAEANQSLGELVDFGFLASRGSLPDNSCFSSYLCQRETSSAMQCPGSPGRVLL
ncbi:MAG: NB-ARC domain-containing protein [Methanothrix sp.]|nr:NB-ARC domain-containing protein [Methanothrix sp.]